MRNFLLTCLALALVFFGAILLSYFNRGVNAQKNGKVEMVANPTSSASTNNNVVEIDGVLFETLVLEPTLLIPENKPDAQTPVKFGIRISNKTQESIRFSRFDTLYPNLFRQDGEAIPLDGGRNGTLNPKESDFPLAMPGESVTLFLDGMLSWQNNKLQLGGSDGFGGLWYFDDLEPGTYKFRFFYQSDRAARQIFKPEEQVLEEIWTGRVATPFVEIRLVES
ncbi:MAG: hypothetical protein WBA93_27385 [Microcoleaceae cyanobacterium]